MKIISYNVNGIRSAMSKGFVDFLKEENPDTVCLQELKAQEQDIDQAALEALGYHCYWFPAEKKGYSGVGILSKEKAKSVVKGMGHKLFDSEGRVIKAVFENCEVISAYFPSGTTGDIRQQVKYEFLEAFNHFIQNDPNKDKLLVCGDYNICHNDIDIHDPIGNKNSSGFLPEERAWMDQWFGSGMHDSFRLINQDPHHYTWWSYRTAARERNKGWRIDYISIGDSIRERLSNAGILNAYVHSDHCGLYAEIK